MYEDFEDMATLKKWYVGISDEPIEDNFPTIDDIY